MQLQTVVGANLDKLNACPPVRMHFSKRLYASLEESSLLAVFQSLGKDADLNSSSFLKF